MSLLDWLLPKKLSNYNDERFWSEAGFLSRTSSGISVNETSALNFSAVYRADCLIASAISTLPLHVYRRVSDAERERVSSHPLEVLLNRNPNEYMDGPTFRATLQSDLNRWGNGYAEIIRAGDQPVALYPLAPSRTSPKILDSGELVYEVRNPGGDTVTLGSRDVFHLRNHSPDGIVGWSPIRLARESLGLGMAAEQFGAAFFGNSSRPAGVLKTPAKLSEAQVKRLKDSWNASQSGTENTGRTAILHGGLEWQSIGLPPNDAQFLETRKFQIVEVARWFGVPPHLLYDLDRATFSNIEHQGLEFLNYSLRPWLTRWESAIHRSLISEQEQDVLYVEHLTDALVKADIQARYTAYSIGRNNGWLSVNDIRQRENMNPVGPAGDVYLAPQNMMPLENLLDMDEEEMSEDEMPGDEMPGDEMPGDEMSEEDMSEEMPEEEAASARPSPRAATRLLIRETLRRMMHREANAATEAARHPGRFLSWLDGYYRRTEPLLADSLRLSCDVWASLTGITPDPVALAAQHCSEAREMVLELTGYCTMADLSVRITTWAGDWETKRPDILTARLLGDEDVVA